MQEFQDKLEKAIGEIVNDRREEIVKELREIDELINTDAKLEEIKADLLDNHILQNPKIKKIDRYFARAYRRTRRLSFG